MTTTMKVELMKKVQVPERVAGRHAAFGLVEGCAGADSVEVDFSRNQLLSPSFVDELLRTLVVDQHVAHVVVTGTSERTRELVQRSSETRQITSVVQLA